MKKAKIVTGGVFLVVGIIMLIVAFVVKGNNKKFFKTAVKTEATIEHIDSYRDYNRTTGKYRTKHDVYISYQTADGAFYEDVKLGYYKNSMREGQTLTVYYDPQAPTDVQAKEGSKLVVWITGGIGALFSVIGGVLLISGAVGRREYI
ncbi:MAG: DUF3592 domain-containing protein [Coprococcus sp.]|nr:DUF3592 domain-containing protein [Coprococcus sp.]